MAVSREEQHVRVGEALTLQPGMMFSDEPGIYIRGEFGVRLEDDMHITETGAELLTPQSESLEESLRDVKEVGRPGLDPA